MFNLFKKKQPKQEDKEKKKKSNGADNKEKDYKSEIEKNVNIYTMPERFRIARKEKSQAKVIGLIIIAGGAIFLIAASVFGYYYFFTDMFGKNTSAPLIIDNPAAVDNEIPAEQQAEPEPEPRQDSPAPVKVEKGAEESYAEMKAEFDKVVNFNSYEAAILKYGSKNRIREFEKEKNQYENSADSFKENIASLLVRLNMPKLSEIGEINLTEKGNTATLSMATVNSNQNGIALMVREGDDWKIESESWENAGSGEEDKLIFQSGLDSDGDGLTDKEENILGSDLNSPDGDGDGYGDLSELINLYNPAGEGKLEDSALIKKYVNSTYGYNLIYPSGWTTNIINDESVIIKTSDNHFIQIIAQANADIQSIDDYYKSLFNISGINPANRVSGDSWQGIKNDDGLILYLTGNARSYIFVLSYNSGGDSALEYKNIFEMIIKSFEVAN